MTETKTTHTPGSLRVSGDRIVCDRTATVIAETSQPQPFADAERTANGRLLAAAWNSYVRAFGPAAVEAAEADTLGALIEAVKWSIEVGLPVRPSRWLSCRPCRARQTPEGDAMISSCPDCTRYEFCPWHHAEFLTNAEVAFQIAAYTRQLAYEQALSSNPVHERMMFSRAKSLEFYRTVDAVRAL